MKQQEALKKVTKILNKNGISVNEYSLSIPENIDFFKAKKIEDKIQSVIFEDQNKECIFQIIDNSLVIQEL